MDTDDQNCIQCTLMRIAHDMTIVNNNHNDVRNGSFLLEMFTNNDVNLARSDDGCGGSGPSFLSATNILDNIVTNKVDSR